MWSVILALSALTFCTNFFSLSLHYGLDLLFGSIFVLVAAVLFGPWWSAVIAVVGSLYSIWLWHHPYALLIFTSEAVLVGLLARRSQRSLLLLDGLFWLLIATPLLWIIYRFPLQFTASQTYLVVVKYAVNGLLNALLASLLLSLASARGWLVLFARISSTEPLLERKAPLAHTLFNVFVGTILLPTVLYTVVNGRQARSRIEAEMDTNLASTSVVLADVAERWHHSHTDLLRSIVQRYNDEGQRRSRSEWQKDLTFVKRSLPDFTGIYAANAAGRAFVIDPARDDTGRLNPLRSFTDRSYYKELRKTRREVTSGVIWSRGRKAEPRIVMAIPFFKGRTWAGYVCGGVNTSQFAQLLKGRLTQAGFHATLVDDRGRVVASTHDNWKPGVRYPRVAPHSLTTFLWAPSDPNLAAMRRWNNSYRVRRTKLKRTVPWDLYVEAPYSVAQSELEDVYKFNLTTALALIGGAFVLASMLAGALARPLDELAHATSDLPGQLVGRRANSNHHWPDSRVGEIDRLIRNFRLMESSLRRTMQQNLQAQSDLEAERARLDEANRLKDDFLAVLSHELRTPLVPVLGYADLIARGVLKGDDATEAARSVERNARVQLRLIEDLLDVSAIMSGKMRLQMGVVQLAMVVREAGETMRTRAHDFDVGLFFDIDETTPYFWGDAARLRQVVWNLVSNSLKFTPAGGNIRVSLSHTQDPKHGPIAILTVTDTGIGIEPDFLPYVFDRFRQAGDHMTRPAGGLGLGLAITQHFIEMHGGTIRADSPGFDQGATFTAILPLTPIPSGDNSNEQ